MARTHAYAVTLTWTGNTGTGTSAYGAFERSSEVTAGDRAALLASADPAFRGDADRWNPEELLIASLSQCHMLWYLVLCAKEGIVVTHYVDHPTGTMVETPDGGGHFEEVTLHPVVTIATGNIDRATALHVRAHDLCFVARSVNFDVRAEATVTVATSPAG